MVKKGEAVEQNSLIFWSGKCGAPDCKNFRLTGETNCELESPRIFAYPDSELDCSDHARK